MGIVTPGIGLIFWMTLSFGILVFILAKFAWIPILATLHEREKTIEEALHQADRARDEMKALKSDNEELLRQAKEERSAILKDARDIRENMIEEAKNKANQEYNRILESAKESINYEKMAAITELKNQIATLSIDIAEKILKEELSNKESQKKHIDKMMDNISFN
ncbi:MAG: F0F1 ATP synthase subunit B [Bacteroidetes bacterium]|nr:F0F1 ATP synthase subunit B [Bacteroidota bacterium]